MGAGIGEIVKKCTLGIAMLVAAVTVTAMAASSTSYTLQPAEFDNGGGLATSTNYNLQASIGGDVFAGTSGSASYLHASDYLATLQAGSASAAPDLQFNPGPANPGDSTEAAGARKLPLLQLQLAAGQRTDVVVTGFTVHSTGTGLETADIEAVHLYLDSDADGEVDDGSSPFASETGYPFTADDGSVAFTLNRNIPSGTSENWLVVFDFDASASGDFQASLGSSDVTATDGGDPVGVSGTSTAGGVKTIGAGPGTLTVALGPANLAEGDHLAPGEEGPVFQFTLAASSFENVSLTALTVHATGTADDTRDIAGISLYADADGDGSVAAGALPLAVLDPPFASDNGAASFTGLSEQIDASQKKTYLVWVRVDSDSMGGQSFGISLQQAGDVEATGMTSAGAVNVEGLPAGSMISIDLAVPPTTVPPGDDGGCGSAGTDASPLGLLLLLAGFLIALRRRRRAPARS